MKFFHSLIKSDYANDSLFTLCHHHTESHLTHSRNDTTAVVNSHCPAHCFNTECKEIILICVCTRFPFHFIFILLGCVLSFVLWFYYRFYAINKESACECETFVYTNERFISVENLFSKHFGFIICDRE